MKEKSGLLRRLIGALPSSGSSQDGQTVFLVYQMETKRIIQGVAVLTTSNL